MSGSGTLSWLTTALPFAALACDSPVLFPMMKWTTCCTLGFVASFRVQSLQLVEPMYTGHSHSEMFQNAQVHCQPVQIVEHLPSRELGLGLHSLLGPWHCAGSSHIYPWIDVAHPCAPWLSGRSTVALGVSTPSHPRRDCAQGHGLVFAALLRSMLLHKRASYLGLAL